MNKSGVSALVILLGAASAALCDTKIATKYVSDGQTTETTAYAKGERLRYEYGEGLTLVRQCDQKRVIQIDDKAKTYMSLPAQSDASGSQATVTDTGERKNMFGYPARHLKTVETADGKKTETDGWYIDLKEAAACSQQDAGGAHRGFPLAYTMTTTGQDGKPASTFTMSVTSLTTAPLDAALFEVPAGYTDSSPKAGDRKSSTKTPGVIRIGVVAVRNQPGGQNPGTMPYQHLLAQLQEAKFDVVPLADGSPEAIAQKAQDWQCDYILYNETAAAEKPPAGGKIGGFLHKAPGIGRVTGGETVEARVNYRLVPAGGGAPVLASSVTGKNGGSFNWKAAASLASNVVPMAMAAKMMTGGGMMNPAMMHALAGGQGAGAPMAGMDPMMGGMSMFLRGSNPTMGSAGASSMLGAAGAMSTLGGAGTASQNPGSAEVAMAAALDQEAKAVIAQLKPSAQ
ncbi:MAG: DUF4412 domain-containing protein [Acidobacteriia bacterium]|nr:DUF4412 domain-containing protein [Terriglobia bacterium]